LALGGSSAINYFACLSDDPKWYNNACRFTNFKKGTLNVPQIVLSSIEVSKPNVVVIHDGHWSNGDHGSHDLDPVKLHSDFEKVLAFNMLLKNANEHGVENVFYLTSKEDVLPPPPLPNIHAHISNVH
jgi:hypothetical protein